MANLDSKYPVSKCCPQCGSTEYSRQKTEATIAFASDRVCKSCQTRYTPPTPVWAAIVFIGIGFLLILVGTIFAPLAISSFFFKHDPLASLGQSLRLIAIASVGILCLVFGVKALRRNREAAGALSGFVLISGIACGGAWSSKCERAAGRGDVTFVSACFGWRRRRRAVFRNDSFSGSSGNAFRRSSPRRNRFRPEWSQNPFAAHAAGLWRQRIGCRAISEDSSLRRIARRRALTG